MRYLKFFIFLFYSSLCFGQNNFPKERSDNSYLKFSLTLSTFNHAEWLFEGTTTYKLTNTFIEIINTAFGDKKGKVIFRKRLPDSLMISSAVKNIGLDSLEDFYYNHCVVMTSGNEYLLRLKTNKLSKEIDMHHFYLKEIDDLVNIINLRLPKKYRLQYLTRDTEQDCKQ